MTLTITFYKNDSELAYDEIRVVLENGIQHHEHRYPVPRLPYASDVDTLFEAAMRRAKTSFVQAMKDHYEKP